MQWVKWSVQEEEEEERDLQQRKFVWSNGHGWPNDLKINE